MGTVHKIAIVGFAPAEALTLITHFRRTLGTEAGYEVVANPHLADLVLVDGANSKVLHELKALRLAARMLLLGANDEFPQLPFEDRPLDRERIRRAVDFVLGRHALPASERPGSSWAATQPFGVSTPGGLAGPGPQAYASTEPMAADGFRTAHGFAATQPMDALRAQGTGQPSAGGRGSASGDAPWSAGDAITDDEMQAFRAARGLQRVASTETPVRAADPEPVELPVVPGFELSEAGDSFLGLMPAQSQGAHAYQDQCLALLVDDKDFDAVKVERALTPLGYLVFRVSSEREAFQALATHEFDLIFVDTRSANGYGTARALLQRTRAAMVRPSIIALSRVGGALERLRARLAGCDLFLAKPVDIDALQEFLRQKESAQAAQRLKRATRQ